jgi:uncharacterized protein involved in cysteine biosynthesis
MLDPLGQIYDSIYFLRQAPEFINKNKLWEGYWKRGWVAKATLISGAILTILFLSNIYTTFTELVQNSDASQSISMGLIVEKIYFQGGIKYVLLIVLEMLIFHFSTKTLDVLEGQESDLKPSDFIAAQVRMIKISVRNYFFEILIGILLAIVLGFVGASSCKSFLMLFVQFYFIGFAFMDNYFEQKGLSIKESGNYIKEHLFAATIIGAAGYILFMIPLIGALVGPFICSVAATSYLHHKSAGLGDLELTDETDFAFKP